MPPSRPQKEVETQGSPMRQQQLPGGLGATATDGIPEGTARDGDEPWKEAAAEEAELRSQGTWQVYQHLKGKTHPCLVLQPKTENRCQREEAGRGSKDADPGFFFF